MSFRYRQPEEREWTTNVLSSKGSLTTGENVFLSKSLNKRASDVQRRGGTSRDEAFGKLKIRNLWCSNSQGWKREQCNHIRISWTLKDSILLFDSSLLLPSERGWEWEWWAWSLDCRLGVCLYKAQRRGLPSRSSPSAVPASCTVSVGKIEGLANKYLLSTYCVPGSLIKSELCCPLSAAPPSMEHLLGAQETMRGHGRIS